MSNFSNSEKERYDRLLMRNKLLNLRINSLREDLEKIPYWIRYKYRKC